MANRHGFLATSSGEAWFYGVASGKCSRSLSGFSSSIQAAAAAAAEHDTVSAWVLHNASNIVMVGTPQTEHTPLALGIVDSDSIEVFGVLSTAMHLDFYGKVGPPALISVNGTTRTRIACANVQRSSMIIKSNEPGMSVKKTGDQWSSAVIAWDDSDEFDDPHGLPDLVHVMIDDLGINGMAFSSNNSEVITPHTSQLAAEGMVLDNLYTYRFCAPSRAALMTGRVPGHGIWETNPLIASRTSVNPAMELLPAVLKRASPPYTTVQVGKVRAHDARSSTYRATLLVKLTCCACSGISVSTSSR